MSRSVEITLEVVSRMNLTESELVELSKLLTPNVKKAHKPKEISSGKKYAQRFEDWALGNRILISKN